MIEYTVSSVFARRPRETGFYFLPGRLQSLALSILRSLEPGFPADVTKMNFNQS